MNVSCTIGPGFGLGFKISLYSFATNPLGAFVSEFVPVDTFSYPVPAFLPQSIRYGNANSTQAPYLTLISDAAQSIAFDVVNVVCC